MDEERLMEIWVPQLSESIDAKVSKEALVKEIGEAVLKRFNIKYVAFAIMSAINERELKLEKTVAEEEIRRGDRLLLLFE